MDRNRFPVPWVIFFSLLTLTGCAVSDYFQRNPNVRQLFSEGLSYEALSEYNLALDRYRKITRRHTGASKWGNRAHLRMARIFSKHLNQPETAANHYGIYLNNSQEAGEPGVRLELARIYRNRNQNRKAANIYRKIIDNVSSEQTVKEAYYYLGKVYLDGGEYKKSVETYRTFMKRFPSGNLADGALFNLAKAYGQLNRIKAQLSVHKRLLDSFPRSGLREVTYMKAFRSAVKLERETQALNLARGYLAEFGRGKYWESISSLVNKKLEVTPSTLEAQSMGWGDDNSGS